MTQSLRCLLSKCEDLHSILTTHFKKPSTVTRTCSPRTGKVETGGALGLAGQPAGSVQWAPDQWWTWFQPNKVDDDWSTAIRLTQAFTCRHARSHTYSYTPMLAQLHPYTKLLIHTRANSHLFTLIHMLTHSLALSWAHIYPYNHTLTLTVMYSKLFTWILNFDIYS